MGPHSAKSLHENTNTNRDRPSGYFIELSESQLDKCVGGGREVDLQSPYQALDICVSMNVVLVTQLVGGELFGIWHSSESLTTSNGTPDKEG
jgi:hypothetical protein